MSLQRTGKIGKSDIGKSLDRGPREFKSRKADKEGNVMLIAEKKVIATHPMNSIKNVAKLMEENDFRRIPVVNAGTERLEGLAVAIDILDFLGGGEKYNIILKDYKGNFFSAINCPISKIMRKASFVDKRSKIEDVVKTMIKNKTSAIPIVEDGEERRVIGIVTEVDVLPPAEVKGLGISVEEIMQKNPITSSLGMMLSDVSKIMVRNGYRRLPVIQEDKLIGIVTVFDILKFLEYGEFQGNDAEEILSERVEKVMEKEVIAVSPEQDLAEISKLVKKTGKGGFPVVGKDGNLIGLITTSDIIKGVYG